MEYITTTDLRTQSSALVHALCKGNTFSLVHRSKVIGIIQPTPKENKIFDGTAFKQLVNILRLAPTSDTERNNILTMFGEKIWQKYFLKQKSS